MSFLKIFQEELFSSHSCSSPSSCLARKHWNGRKDGNEQVNKSKMKEEIRLWARSKKKRSIIDRDRVSSAWCTDLWKTPSLHQAFFLTPCGFPAFLLLVFPHSLTFSPSLSLIFHFCQFKDKNIYSQMRHAHVQTISNTHTHTQWETEAESACDLDQCD